MYNIHDWTGDGRSSVPCEALARMESRAEHTPLYCARMMRAAIARGLLTYRDEQHGHRHVAPQQYHRRERGAEKRGAGVQGSGGSSSGSGGGSRGGGSGGNGGGDGAPTTATVSGGGQGRGGNKKTSPRCCVIPDDFSTRLLSHHAERLTADMPPARPPVVFLFFIRSIPPR